jgi:hypothetical protein
MAGNEPGCRRTVLAQCFEPLLRELQGRTGFCSYIALDLGDGLESSTVTTVSVAQGAQRAS